MFVTRLALTLACVLLPYSIAAQVPVPMASQPGLTYTEDFADIKNWADNFTAGDGTNRFSSVLLNSDGTIPDGARITHSTNAFKSGPSPSSGNGVQKGSVSPNPIGTIVLYAGGNIAAVAIDFHMDFSGVTAGMLSFDWRALQGGTAVGSHTGSLRVYWSMDGTTFTELPTAGILGRTNGSDAVSITGVELPEEFDGSATARLRFYQHGESTTGTGGRPKFSIDNLTVTAAAPSSAPVSVSGRVMTADGRAIAGARLSIEGGNLKFPRWALANPFGRFRFEGLTPGVTCVISVGSKRFTFTEPVQAVTPQEDISDLNFTSEP